MNETSRRLAVALIIMCAGAAAAGGSEPPKPTNGRTGKAPTGFELMDAIQKLQQLVEQGQSELRQLRDENDNLGQELERTRREIADLRQDMSRLGTVTTSRAAVPEEPGGGGPEPSGSTGASTQAAAPPSPPSGVEARLGIVEERVAVNAAQIREQAQTKVEAESRFDVRLSGMILSNTYFNTSDNSEAAVPMAASASPTGVANNGNNFGSTLRQTTLGFGLTGPRVGDARLSAHVDLDFYGGTGGGYQGEMLGLMRMRTAAAHLAGSNYAVDMGLLAPMISPLSPDSLAAVYYPALGDAGNLWQWRPQINAERRFAAGESSSVILQGGLIFPFGENFYGRALEGKPGYQSRMAFARRNDDERRFELGAGGYFYPRQFGFGRTVNSYALTGDWVIPLRSRLELKGEVYYGDSITLSEPAGGDISGRFAFNGPLSGPKTVFRGVRSRGGWAQMHFTATSRLGLNVAFGLDDPRDRDYFLSQLHPTSRLRNQALSVNSIYRLRSNFLFALEYRHLRTRYPGILSTNGHVNLAIGYAF